MASFTDIIPQFNPYVQQLPVEAMVQVGMEKQKRYEENVTKIQSQMDAIAGLAIARPTDRAYLQSKLNQLGSKLTTLAGADFSNFQLANSVSGMTKQIVRDGVVQTAVRATAHAQQQQQKMENGKADGTWSVENEDLYNSQYQKWYNGKTAGESFGAEYIPYRDVYKKLKGIAKDVGVDENLVQNLFNPDGSVNKVMVETYSKGRDPNKIYDAFVNGLDESDYRQLSITGRYKYKGYSGEQLAEVLNTSNNEYVSTVSARKLDLESKLQEITKLRLTLKKPEEIKKLEDAELQIKSTILKLDDGIKSSTDQLNEVRQKLASGDEDYANSIRSKIHTNKFLTSLSKDFADKTSYVKYADNPLWKAMMEEEKFNFDKWYKRENLKIEERKARAAEKQAKAAEDALTPPAPAPVPGDKIDVFGKVQTSYSNLLGERQSNFAILAQRFFGGDAAKMEAHVNSRVKQGVTKEQAIAEIGVQEYTKIISEIKDPAKRSVNQKMDRNLLQAVQNISTLNGRISSLKTSMDQSETNAMRNASPDVAKINEAKSKLKPITLEVPDIRPGEEISLWEGLQSVVGLGPEKATRKKEMTLQPNEIMDFLDVSRGTGYFSSKEEERKASDAEKRLRSRFSKKEFDAIAYKFASQEVDLHQGDSPVRYLNYLQPISSAYDFGSHIYRSTAGKDSPEARIGEARAILNSSAYENYSNALSLEYEKSFSGFYPSNVGLVMNEKTRPGYTATVNNILKDNPEYTEEARKMLLDNNSEVVVTADPSIMGVDGSSYYVTITGKEGKSSEPIMINPMQYQLITGTRPPQIDLDLELVKSRINSSVDGSTNKNGVGSWESAFLSPFDFPNVKETNIVGADLTKELNNPNSYYMTLYVTPSGYRSPISVPIQGSYSLTEALALPSIMNDRTINAILK
jgi:hypothetical protein